MIPRRKWNGKIETPAGFQTAYAFQKEIFGIGDMFQDFGTDNMIKNIIQKRKSHPVVVNNIFPSRIPKLLMDTRHFQSDILAMREHVTPGLFAASDVQDLSGER